MSAMDRSKQDRIAQIQQEIATLKQQIRDQNADSVYPDPEERQRQQLLLELEYELANLLQPMQQLQTAATTATATATLALDPHLSPQLAHSSSSIPQQVASSPAAAAAAATATSFPNGRRRYWKCGDCKFVGDRKDRIRNHYAKEHPDTEVKILEADPRPR